MTGPGSRVSAILAGVRRRQRQSESAGHIGIGLTVKSGWAAMVLVRTSDRLEVLNSTRVELSDPDVPESRQPFHDGFSKAREPGQELTNVLKSVHRYGSRSLVDSLDSVAAGADIGWAAVVVGSLIEPERLGNTHMRIHAQEGQLFRELVVDTLRRRGLQTRVWRDRDLYGLASDALGRSEAAIRTLLTQAGKDHAGPWRAEQKAAALAAWIAPLAKR